MLKLITLATLLSWYSITALVVTDPCCTVLSHRNAMFGPSLPVDTSSDDTDPLFPPLDYYHEISGPISGSLVPAPDSNPLLCGEFNPASFHSNINYTSSILFLPRGGCAFAEKVYFAQKLGAAAVVIYQPSLPPNSYSSIGEDDLIVMAEDSRYAPRVRIPSVFVSHHSFRKINPLMVNHKNSLQIMLNETGAVAANGLGPDGLPMMWDSMVFLIKVFLIIWTTMGMAYLSGYVKDRYNRHMRQNIIKSLPTKQFKNLTTEDVKRPVIIREKPCRKKDGNQFELLENIEDVEINRENVVDQEAQIEINEEEVELLDCDNCVICLSEFEQEEVVTILPCKHVYHKECIDPWLTNKSSLCPMCKQSIFSNGESRSLNELNTSDTRSNDVGLEETAAEQQRRGSLALTVAMIMVILMTFAFMLVDDDK